MNIDNYSEYWAGWARFWKTDALSPPPTVDECIDIGSKHAPQADTEQRKYEIFVRLIAELKNNKRQYALFLPLLLAINMHDATDEEDAEEAENIPEKVEKKPGILHLDKCHSIEMLDILLGRAKANERYIVADAFVHILDAGNRCERWKIPLPAIPISVPQERSPFTVEDFYLGLEGTRVRQEFVALFVQKIDFVVMGKEAAAGCLTLCALLFDGIYDYDLLAQLPDGVASGKNKLRWLDLKVSFSLGKGDAVYVENRRVILSPLTRKLAVLYFASNKHNSSEPECERLTRAQSKKVAWARIKAYCKSMGGQITLPQSLPALVKNASMRMRQEIPSVHVTYALDSRVSATLPACAWERLISPPVTFALEKPESIDEIEQDTRNQVINTRTAVKVDERGLNDESEKETTEALLPAMQSLYACLPRSKGKRKTNEALRYLAQWFDDIEDNTPKSIIVLARWVEYRLTKAPRSRHSPAPSTVYNHLTTIGRRLIGQLGFDDITTLSEEDFIELYEVAIESGGSPQLKRSITWVLRLFHGWLSKTNENVPDLSETGVFALYGKRITAVDANLISVAVFNRAVRWIEQSGKGNEERREAAVLLMALGFYGSLRRSEAIGLNVSDISRSKMLHINLKCRKNSLLKTTSSIRQIPIGLFLPDNFCQRLRRWRDARSRKKMLFTLLSDKSVENEVITKDSGVFDIIKEALWRAGHDSSLRFHHLRHSFASWLMISLFLAEQSEYFGEIHDEGVTLPDWFVPEEETRTMLVEQCKVRRKELLGNTPTSRRQAWLVASLIGHLGPDVTLTHYIHLMDVMLGMSIRSSTPELSHKAVANISGISREHLERLLTKLKCRKLCMPDMLDVLSDYFMGLQFKKEKTNKIKSLENSVDIVYEQPLTVKGKIKLIAKSLDVAVNQSESISSFVTTYGLTIDVVNSWVMNYQNLPCEIKKYYAPRNRKNNGKCTALFKLPNTKKRWGVLAEKVELLESVLGRLRVDVESTSMNKMRSKALLSANLFLEAWVARQGGGLILTNLVKGKRILKWLFEIGIELELLNIIFIPNKESKIGLPAQKKYWKTKMNVHINFDSKSFRCSLSSRGGLFIGEAQLKEILDAVIWMIITQRPTL